MVGGIEGNPYRREHILKAHLSQPLGKPLHRFIGELIMDENALILSGKDKETGTPSEVFIPREKIHEVFLGWDDVLRRWKDTRAWIRPPPNQIRRERENKNSLCLRQKT